MSKFFAYDPDDGFQIFDNQEEAIAYCNKAIDGYRAEAGGSDGWYDEVEEICWGKIKQQAIMCDKKPWPVDDDDPDGDPPFDYTCDYCLSDISPMDQLLPGVPI